MASTSAVEVRISAELLPKRRHDRMKLLGGYFDEMTVREVKGSKDLFSVSGPPTADYLVDPMIKSGLAWYSRHVADAGVRSVYRATGEFGGVPVSLSDAWTCVTFAPFMTRERPVFVLHVDDHDDLMSPRLSCDEKQLMSDLLTGAEVDPAQPETFRSAVLSGAIGMGSFLVPLLRTFHGEVRHLRRLPIRSQGRPDGRYRLDPELEHDLLLDPTSSRPTVRIRPANSKPADWAYIVTSDLNTWLAGIPDNAALLLHVDCDYFNNRFDGDSDWQEAIPRNDHSAAAVSADIEQLLSALSGLGRPLLAAHIGLSPGFFPAEMWPAVTAHLANGIGPLLASGDSATPIDHEAVPNLTRHGQVVTLREGRRGRGGGRFWHVFADEVRAGKVELRAEESDALGTYWGLSIELNQASQGLGIGSIAYRLAAFASELPEVWLHMRKSNVASRRSAANAGFEVVAVPGDRQLVMRWRRSTLSVRRPDASQ